MKTVAAGFQFPEGPAFRGDDLFLVDLHAGCLARIKGSVVDRFLYTGGRPNGLAIHLTGDLFVADSGLAAILRVTGDGAEVVASRWGGVPFLGPNDLVFDRAGRLYFTDPGRTFPRSPAGRVFCLDPDGTVRMLVDGLAFPNGIALSVDERQLFVAETQTGRILAFERDELGGISGPAVYAQVGGAVGPDGLAIDEAGNLYVAMFGDGVVRIVSPGGEVTRELPAGGRNPTNVAFGGPQWRTLVVTEAETGAVYALEVDVPGLRLYGSGMTPGR